MNFPKKPDLTFMGESLPRKQILMGDKNKPWISTYKMKTKVKLKKNCKSLYRLPQCVKIIHEFFMHPENHLRIECIFELGYILYRQFDQNKSNYSDGKMIKF